MTDRLRCWALACASLGLVVIACGEVERFEQPIRPSLEVFQAQVQPVLERQGCSRSACHGTAPEGVGGLFLLTPEEESLDDPAVLANFQAAAALVDLSDPADSLLIRAPFLGLGGEVDHPEYVGRFTTTTDCCYCKVLLWICEDGDSEACQGCRDAGAPQCACEAAPHCSVSAEGVVTPAEGATLTWAKAVGPLLQQPIACGAAGCHGGNAPTCPDLADVDQVVRTDNPCDPDDEAAWMTPCEPGGGAFVQYALGVGAGADATHAGLLSEAAAASVLQWVTELGAPR